MAPGFIATMTTNLVSIDLPNRRLVRAERRRSRPSRNQFVESKLVTDTARLLYGDLGEFGVAIVMHNFLSATEFDWAGTFQPDCAEICLNLEGRGRVGEQQRALEFGPK